MATAPALQRGILCVQANADPIAALSELTSGWNRFQSRYEEDLRRVNAVLDQHASLLASSRLNGGPGFSLADPSYSADFSNWVRFGRDEEALRSANAEGARARIMAAMSAGSDTAGGYLAPVEWDRRIREQLRPISPLRRMAEVQETAVRGYSTVWADGWGSGWVGETAARPQTSTPTLAPLTFDHGEIYANVAVTQQLLDDAGFNLEEWVATKTAQEFARQEAVAFIVGDGVNKPRGLLTYAPGASSASVHPAGPVPIGVTAAAPAAITADDLILLVYAVPGPYRMNAAWLMNSNTASLLARLKDSDGRHLWTESLAAGQPATLLGYPVAIDENMPDPVAEALPLVFGDFRRGYVINDRTAVRLLRDPYTNKPFVQFYMTKRVGGGVQDPHALRLLKMAAA
jgi:HK97 family phage major capsid protein